MRGSYFTRRFQDYKCWIRLEVCTHRSHTDFVSSQTQISPKDSTACCIFLFFFPPCYQAQICLRFCLLSRTECENVATTLVVFGYKDEEPTAWIKRLMCVWDKCQREAPRAAHRTQEGELWKRCLLFHFYSSCLLATSVLDRLYNLHRSFPSFI